MPHQLKCTTCDKRAVISEDDYDNVMADEGGIPCCEQHCVGVMVIFGHTLKRKRTVESKADYIRRRRRSENRRPTKRSRLAQEAARTNQAFDDSSEDENEEEEEDEDEWLLPREFNPAMRLTDAHMEPARVLPLGGAGHAFQKCPGLQDVTNPILGERAKSTKSAMGDRSAWKVSQAAGAANAHRFKLGAKNYYEWCHLHGDSLGGRCEAANLVAAHYAVNTCMLAIEEVVSKQSGIQTRVTAYCKAADVADFIVYEVYRKANGQRIFSITIDGLITSFSRNDYDTVSGIVRRYFGS
jgi:hypothetical protein